MKNYYERQKNSTLTQIRNLYKEKDVTFRGFRHSAGPAGQVGATRAKQIAMQGNEVVDGMVNWESSQTGDGDRFSQQGGTKSQNKPLTMFDNYLKSKQNRAESKKASKSKNTNISASS